MTCEQRTAHLHGQARSDGEPAALVGALARRLYNGIAQGRRLVIARRKRRLAMRELESLSDYQLRDIGLTRAAIPDAVDGLRERSGGRNGDRS